MSAILKLFPSAEPAMEMARMILCGKAEPEAEQYEAFRAEFLRCVVAPQEVERLVREWAEHEYNAGRMQESEVEEGIRVRVDYALGHSMRVREFLRKYVGQSGGEKARVAALLERLGG